MGKLNFPLWILSQSGFKGNLHDFIMTLATPLCFLCANCLTPLPPLYPLPTCWVYAKPLFTTAWRLGICVSSVHPFTFNPRPGKACNLLIVNHFTRISHDFYCCKSYFRLIRFMFILLSISRQIMTRTHMKRFFVDFGVLAQRLTITLNVTFFLGKGRFTI